MPAYDVNDSFADLRQDKLQQAAEAADEEKCGTCIHFLVKPPEVELARAARPMSRCGPGSHCSGGPVRGQCAKWEERGASGPQVDSTFVCSLYEPGGPSVIGAADGSFQRIPESLAKAADNGVAVALGAVAVVAFAPWAAGKIGELFRNRG